VLEEHVDERLTAAVDLHAVQQIGMRVAQLVVHEGARADRERSQIQVRRDCRGQDEFELAAGEIGLSECGLEQGVVRGGRRRHARSERKDAHVRHRRASKRATASLQRSPIGKPADLVADG
jgi:hypothetical protein